LGFAGDTQLRRALDALLEWCARWKMVLNIRKCICITFSRRRFVPSFSIGDSVLSSVRHARYLGVWFSSDLT